MELSTSSFTSSNYNNRLMKTRTNCGRLIEFSSMSEIPSLGSESSEAAKVIIETSSESSSNSLEGEDCIFV